MLGGKLIPGWGDAQLTDELRDTPASWTLSRTWLSFAFLIPAVVASIAWHWGRPWIVSDTATGLLAWKSWQAGGPWNCVLEPSPADLARDTYSWISWWSPGQYVWPGIFWSMRLSLGDALIVSGVVASWLRSIGFYLLMRKLGLSALPAAIFCAVEASSWHLFWSFGMYSGGEVVQATIIPWLILAFAHLRGRMRWWLPTVPFLLFGAAFGKHSAFIAGLAATLWLWWETIATARRSKWRWISSAALLAGAVAAAHWAIARWITGSGPTPAGFGQVSHGWWLALGYPAFAPVSAAFGAGSLIGRAFAVLQISSDGWQRIAVWCALLAPVWLAFYTWLAKHAPTPSFRRLLLAFLAVYIPVLVVLYAAGASISIEDRHARPVGMLVLAAITAVAFSATRVRRSIRHGLTFVVFATAVYGLAAETARAVTLARLDRVGPSGITQPDVSTTSMIELLRRDRSGAGMGQVIFVGDPKMALEVRESRVISTDAGSRPMPWFRERTWRGRVPKLLLVLPATWNIDPRTDALRLSFVDYRSDEWRSEIVGDCLFLHVDADIKP